MYIIGRNYYERELYILVVKISDSTKFSSLKIIFV